MSENIKELNISEVGPVLPMKAKAGDKTTIKFQESARPFDENRAILPEDEIQLAKQKLRDLEIEEKKMVRGIFRYHECPKGVVEFPFKKYKGEQIKKYSMKDGEIYTIPLSVARHLNTNPWYPVASYSSKDPGVVIEEKVFRMSFQNLEF